MSNASDFIIENGVLTKYVGPGGDVVIPAGVTEIKNGSFARGGVFTGNKNIAVARPESGEGGLDSTS